MRKLSHCMECVFSVQFLHGKICREHNFCGFSGDASESPRRVPLPSDCVNELILCAMAWGVILVNL